MQAMCAPPIDVSARVIDKVSTVMEARALPRGAVVGDLHGGLTFSDQVAAALQVRSNGGWHDVETKPGGDLWTIIVLDR